MNQTKEKDKTSKEKILMVASRLFAQKGYKGTTIRDICKEADTYQISVNYYFQGKENLFHESLLKAYEISNAYELNNKIHLMEPEEFIDASIRCKINSFFDNSDKSLFLKIVSHVFFEQMTLPEEIVNMTFKDDESNLKKALNQLTDYKIDEKDIDYCYFLVLSQLFTVTFHPEINKKFLKCCKPNSKEIEWFINKIKTSLMENLKNSKKTSSGV